MTTRRAAASIGTRIGLFLVFAVLITPLAVAYRLFRRRRGPGWRPARPAPGRHRYRQPW
ncbi:hypothetical protein ACIBQX_38780 [Nonomuraea sp. NPDC049714]|uniref:hypothetical protein n=1 Tax=Nonomuraea sp. NPDC049714 TaxID=3364357 RepID=UPI00379D0CF1